MAKVESCAGAAPPLSSRWCPVGQQQLGGLAAAAWGIWTMIHEYAVIALVVTGVSFFLATVVYLRRRVIPPPPPASSAVLARDG